MTLPNTTNKQKEIFNYLYTFRFLHTNHFQKLFNHQDKRRVKAWLKDLKDKEFINLVENGKNNFEKRTKPMIYCLAPKARHILKKNENCDLFILDRIYKEKTRGTKFVNKCLSIADLYLFFLSKKEPGHELGFFTESELVRYDYFPKALPSAYISITTQDGSLRYFLEFFGAYTPAFEMRNRINVYLHYVDSGNWEANANGEPFPSIIFICPSKNLKTHIYFYTKAKFEKEFEEKFDLYLTTWDIIQSGTKKIWEKVSISNKK
jgi:hypothetical protein